MTKKGMTWNELAKSIWTAATPEQIDVLLWHCTAFPVADIETVTRQLKESYEKSGGDFHKAVDIAEKEIEEAMKNSIEPGFPQGSEVKNDTT